jgi:hypothetical protein
MDHQSLQQILDRYGLASEPAFDDVKVEISPILPDRKGRQALGLYFPTEELIVLPPTLDVEVGTLGESVAIHEFGHRHGHFYYNNLTEPYAENYRREYVGDPIMLSYHGNASYHDVIIHQDEVYSMMPPNRRREFSPCG